MHCWGWSLLIARPAMAQPHEQAAIRRTGVFNGGVLSPTHLWLDGGRCVGGCHWQSNVISSSPELLCSVTTYRSRMVADSFCLIMHSTLSCYHRPLVLSHGPS